jgi:hypothetical protein
MVGRENQNPRKKRREEEDTNFVLKSTPAAIKTRGPII